MNWVSELAKVQRINLHGVLSHKWDLPITSLSPRPREHDGRGLEIWQWLEVKDDHYKRVQSKQDRFIVLMNSWWLWLTTQDLFKERPLNITAWMEGEHRAIFLRGAISCWWLLAEGKAVFNRGMAPDRLIMPQWMALHSCACGQHYWTQWVTINVKVCEIGCRRTWMQIWEESEGQVGLYTTTIQSTDIWNSDSI